MIPLIHVDSLNFGSKHLLTALYLMQECHYIKDYSCVAYYLYIVQTLFHKLKKCMRKVELSVCMYINIILYTLFIMANNNERQLSILVWENEPVFALCITYCNLFDIRNVCANSWWLCSINNFDSDFCHCVSVSWRICFNHWTSAVPQLQAAALNNKRLETRSTAIICSFILWSLINCFIYNHWPHNLR